MFCKTDVLKKTKILRKALPLKSFFKKMRGLKPATLLIKRLRNMFFPTGFTKLLKYVFYTKPEELLKNTSGLLLSFVRKFTVNPGPF